MQSIGDSFEREEAVSPISIRATKALGDGTAIMLYELAGDPEVVRDILDDDDLTEGYQITQAKDVIVALIQYEPTAPVEQFFGALREHQVVIDESGEIPQDGGFRMRIIGPQQEIQSAIAGIPEQIVTRIEKVGTYTPETANLLSELSDRQREVLQVAHENGYYQQPRQTTYRDIAAELGCTPGNVGTVLRTCENTIIGELCGARPAIERPASR